MFYKKGIIKPAEHEDYLWIEKKNINQYDLVAGDKKILSLI